MNTLEIKQQLHNYIDLADERMAGALLAMFQNYFQHSKEPIIAYTTKGQPLTKKKMVEEVMTAVKQVEKGNFLSTEQVRKKIKKD